MNKQSKLSIDFLNEVLSYNPETGVLKWKKTLSMRAQSGSIAGSKMSIGYIQIGINGIDYYAHRIAWFMTHGKWPENQIDHINLKRDDNRIKNLREANNVANGMNKNKRRKDNKSGHSGVHFDKSRNKWMVTVGKKSHGRFFNKEDAIAHRKRILIETYGSEFSHKP
jgi:hypothetical protein